MDILVAYICIPKLPYAYLNVAPREAAPTSSNVKFIKEEVYTYELDTLADMR